MQLITQIETRHRPEVIGLITRIAHLQRFNRGNKLFAEGFGNPGLNDKALRGGTNLPGILIAANHRGFYRFIEVGIIQDDKRIGTAQFKNAFLQRRAGLGANRLTGAHAAGYRHRGNTRIVDHPGDTVIGRVNPAKYAGRQPCLINDLANQRRAPHHVRRMFQQIAIPRQQNRYRTAQNLPQREVPRHNGENRAQRTILNHRIVIFHLSGFGRQHGRAVFRIPVAEIRGFRHFTTRLGNRFAHLKADHLRHLFGAGAQRVTDFTQSIGALFKTDGTPLTITLLSKRNRRIHLLFARPGQRRHPFSRGRVDGNRVSCR